MPRPRIRLLLPWALALLADAARGADCPNASTLVRGDAGESDAVAFDAACVERRFNVTHDSAAFVSLNLSHLNLEAVASYPPVNKLLLFDNFLTTFRSPSVDSLMEELDLHQNKIADLNTVQLPRRLVTLNLANNQIAVIGPSVPWPDALELKWLALDQNPIQSIAANAFTRLTSLTYLSMSGMNLVDLGELAFPPTLNTLNLSRNMLTSDKSNFSTPLVALKTLDLSNNNLTRFPDLSSFTSLTDLSLGNNVRITSISGVRLPPKLKNLDLTGNPVQNIEVTEADVDILKNLDSFMVPTSALSSSCVNGKAKSQVVRDGLAVCVLSDDAFVPGSTPSSTSAPSPSSSSPTSPRADSGSLGDTDSSNASSNSRMSSNAMLLLGGGCFAMGLLVAAFVFLVRRDKKAVKRKPPQFVTFAPEASDGSGRTFGRSFDDLDDYTNSSWVFGSPAKDFGGANGQQNVVAILEDDKGRRGRGRSKVEDLLVYEIPLDEINVREPMAQKHQGAETMFKAEYQGFQVVMHALLSGRSKLQRGRRRHERAFVEQVRLASLLEHVCIVQFIGITLGSNSQSQHPSAKWKMGVVFEYMHSGSLASIFHEERTRREGKLYQRKLADPKRKAEAIGAFTWYPSPQTSVSDAGSPGNTVHRCKLSIALDVAMALVYLHSNGYVHGDLRAEKVLVNEQGEAKLSGMDIDLAMNVPDAMPSRMDVRASAVKARMKVKHMFQTSISQSPALDSSLLNSRSGVVPMAVTSMTPTMLGSASSRARRRGMQGDVYAFGLLLWELDTMMCVDAMKRLTAATAEVGEEHQMLRFSPECPAEIQYLARRCWHPDLRDRPSALDLQEEIVRLLEGRLTSLSDRSIGTHRWSRRTNSSRNGNSSFASSHSSSHSISVSDYRSSSLVIAETEV